MRFKVAVSLPIYVQRRSAQSVGKKRVVKRNLFAPVRWLRDAITMMAVLSTKVQAQGQRSANHDDSKQAVHPRKSGSRRVSLETKLVLQ